MKDPELTRDELDRLPVRSVVRDARDVVWVRMPDQQSWSEWHGTHGGRAATGAVLQYAPIVALWVPEPEPPQVGDVIHGTIVSVKDFDARLFLITIKTPEGETRTIKVRREGITEHVEEAL